MYTKAVVWATSATPLPMWDPEGSGMVPIPNMVADFRDTKGGYVEEKRKQCGFRWFWEAQSACGRQGKGPGEAVKRRHGLLRRWKGSRKRLLKDASFSATFSLHAVSASSFAKLSWAFEGTRIRGRVLVKEQQSRTNVI
jgi:hypothetical protein